ncbi:MAG: single-stranded-DNA-specific exonuclease RecJ [Pseudomonadota bacterium]|nr:single-stranded-DNA-specific exonuclease RecJ [Pseudomonadota bacterium]
MADDKPERTIPRAVPSTGTPVAIKRRPEPPAADALPDDLHPLLRRLYGARGVRTESGCTLSLKALHGAHALKDIARAVDLLAEHVRGAGSILVVGDYDADGATGSALAVRGLRSMGAEKVSYLVPSRFAFGYGLSPEVVDAAAPGRPDLILTVDNGIASVAGVSRANELGISVIVTDHHLPGDELPDAAAIVNPNQRGDEFPSKHLAGVGVVFYLLAALRTELRRQGWFGPTRPVPNLAELLDLVALGTVADVVALDENNRILVEQGLRRIRSGHCCPGVTALLEVAGRDPAQATARDLGFSAGPRLNAAGRLEDMSLGVECLLTDDPARAAAIARQLDGLNRRRREIEGEMKERAEAMLDALRLDGQGLPPALCLFEEGWHQGVIGILAARIRERYHRPVIAFAEADGGLLRGSARSIDGLHMRDLIDAVDKRNPGLIDRFGGHAMAAGITLQAGALEDFRDAVVAEARRELGDQPPTPEILSDGELPPDALDLSTAQVLRGAGPWGKGFPEPLFDGLFQVVDTRVVGDRHLRLRLRAPGGGLIDAIGFRLAEQARTAAPSVHLAYRLDVNEYRGIRSPQLIVEHLQWTS